MKKILKHNVQNSESLEGLESANMMAKAKIPLQNPSISSSLDLLKKKKASEESQDGFLEDAFTNPDLGSDDWSRVLGDYQLAQLDAAAVAGSSAGAGAGAAGAAAAAAGAGTIGVGAATSVAAITSTVTTVTAVGAATTAPTLGVVAGSAAVAGGGGGGGGAPVSVPVNSGPAPLEIPTFTLDDPPTAPRPEADPTGTYSPDDGSPLEGDGDDGIDVSVTTVPPFELRTLSNQLETLPGRPGNSLYKSLVIDLNSALTPGDYRVYYYTQKEDGQSVEYTTIGYYKGFSDVTGTYLSDMISGDAGANVLDGGRGNDIIYGGGGQDTLRGDRGTDWVLFKPLTRDVTLDTIYQDNLVLDLGAGTYSFFTGSGGSRTQVSATASGFENAVGSDASDTMIGSSGANTLVGAGGNDIIRALGGDDVIYGGLSTACGNQITGGDGADFYYVGYDLDPVKLSQRLAESQYLTQVAGVDVIHDWDDASGSTTRDTLIVNSTGVAVIGGLKAHASLGLWSGSDQIDLRSQVTNRGTIVLAAGGGNNQLWMSTGHDEVHVGAQFTETSGVICADQTLTTTAGAYDRIWDWDSNNQSADGVADQLTVYVGSRALLGSVLSTASAPSYNWSAADRLDLRTSANAIQNNGVLIVDVGGTVGAQDYDTVWGTAGVDYLSGGNAGAYDVRDVTKPGDVLWGGAGADRFYVGYQYNSASSSYADANFVDKSIIGTTGRYTSTTEVMDWASGSDTLYVGQNATAIIGGLYDDANRYTATDWSANNTVNLSTGVVNAGKYDASDLSTDSVNSGAHGKVVARLGIGNDTFYGSEGNDWVYVGAAGSSNGFDYVSFGAIDNDFGNAGDGADRLYLDHWNTRVVVNGFDANDSIYIDRQMLLDFMNTTGISTFKHYAGSVNDVADYYSASLIPQRRTGLTNTNGSNENIFDNLPNISVEGESNTTGRAYQDGLSRSFLGLKLSTTDHVYGGAYNAELDNRGAFTGLSQSSNMWFSNGAFTNASHIRSEYVAESAVTGAAAGAFGIGYALLTIPFVGPILGAPFITAGAFYTDDKVNHTFGHLNPEFNIDLTSSYVSTLRSTVNLSSSLSEESSYSSYRFTDLFGAPNDGFKPSVEFTGNSGGDSSNNNGIGGIVAVTDSDGSDTLLYLVYSADRMIQDNETRLIAHIKGGVSASQIKLYNNEDDIYQLSDTAPVSLPPDVRLLDVILPISSTTVAASASAPVRIYNLDATPTVDTDFIQVKFGFNEELLAGDDVVIRGVNSAGQTVLTATYDYVSGADANAFEGSNIGYFKNIADDTSEFRYMYQFVDKATREVAGQEDLVTYSVEVVRNSFSKVSNTSSVMIGLNGVSVNAYGSGDEAKLVFDYPYAANLSVVQVASPNTSIDTQSSGSATTENSEAAVNARTMTINATEVAVGGAGFYKVVTTPTSGGQAYDLQEDFYFGSTGNDIGSASAATDRQLMFGFAGNDNLTGGVGDDALYGGSGDDTLVGGNGADTLSGGVGADTLTGGDGNDKFILDSLSGVDTITDFSRVSTNTDQIQLLGSVFNVSSGSTGSATAPNISILNSSEFVTITSTSYGATPSDDQINTLIVNAIAANAGSNLFYDTAKGNLYYDADSSVGVSGQSGYLSWVHVATFTGAPTLLYSDFAVI